MTTQLLEEGQNTIKENRTNIEENTIKYNDLKNNYDSLIALYLIEINQIIHIYIYIFVHSIKVRIVNKSKRKNYYG